MRDSFAPFPRHGNLLRIPARPNLEIELKIPARAVENQDRCWVDFVVPDSVETGDIRSPGAFLVAEKVVRLHRRRVFGHDGGVAVGSDRERTDFGPFAFVDRNQSGAAGANFT